MDFSTLTFARGLSDFTKGGVGCATGDGSLIGGGFIGEATRGGDSTTLIGFYSFGGVGVNVLSIGIPVMLRTHLNRTALNRGILIIEGLGSARSALSRLTLLTLEKRGNCLITG